MTEKPLKTFKDDWFRKLQKYMLVVVGLPMFIFSQYGMIVSGVNDYIKKDYIEFFLAIIFFFLFFYTEYICIVVVYEIKTTATKLDVYTDRIVGHTQYKKNKWVLYYSDIKKIYPRGKVIRGSLTLEDNAQNKYYISIYYDFLQECIEYIKHQSINLDVYELGSIPKNKIEWKKSDNSII